MFQKSPALTAFWTFIESSRYITGLVIYLDGFPVQSVHIFITIYQANIFGQKHDFQTKYFRWNTDFSKVLFSAKHQVFKRNIFGDAESFPEYTCVLLIAECNPCNVDFIHESVMFIAVLCQINTVFSRFSSL
jgi:hypothetical protein